MKTIRAANDDKLIMALPNGRILTEVMPLLRRAGIEPEPAFDDPSARQLRFATSDPGLDLIRVRAFDAATFVAFGAAHIGVAGNDVLMEFDYSDIYAPLDLDIGHCRMVVAGPTDAPGAMCASPVNIPR
jgi:ATP phosphoribosyltransferase